MRRRKSQITQKSINQHGRKHSRTVSMHGPENYSTIRTTPGLYLLVQGSVEWGRGRWYKLVLYSYSIIRTKSPRTGNPCCGHGSLGLLTFKTPRSNRDTSNTEPVIRYCMELLIYFIPPLPLPADPWKDIIIVLHRKGRSIAMLTTATEP